MCHLKISWPKHKTESLSSEAYQRSHYASSPVFSMFTKTQGTRQSTGKNPSDEQLLSTRALARRREAEVG